MADNSPNVYSNGSYGSTWDGVFSKRLRHYIKIASYCFLFLLYNAYVVYAAIYSFDSTKSWCKDIKLVIAITIFAYVLVLVIQLVKLYNMSALSGFPEFLFVRMKSYKYYKYYPSVLAIAVCLILIIAIIVDGNGDVLKLRSLCGYWLLILIALSLSKHPTRIRLRPLIWGIALQIIIALIFRQTAALENTVNCIMHITELFGNYIHRGAEYLFGYLISGELQDSEGNKLKIKETPFAFRYATVVLFYSVLFYVMNYLKISSWLFVKIGWLFEVTINTTAIESLIIVTDLIWGHINSVLLTHNHLGVLTKSESHTVLVAAFVTIGPTAGIFELMDIIKVKANHLIFANFISLPAIITFSKLLYPEISITVSKYSDISLYSDSSITNIVSMNVLMSAVKGAIFAVHYICVIGGNILGSWALLRLVCDVIHWPAALLDWDFLTVEWILSLPFVPMLCLTGVSFEESKKIAHCVGLGKLWGAELSYSCLSSIENQLSERSFLIAIYAACGFSGIVLTSAYLGAMAFVCPAKLPELAQLIPRAICAASFVVLSTAYIAGCIIVH